MTDSLAAKTDTLIYNPKLSALKPIFVPDPVKFEPVTAGWYILFGLIILLLLFISYKIIKKYRANAYRRLSVSQLMRIKNGLNELSVIQTVQEVAAILKGTAIISYSREKVAGLAGEEWLEFLISTIPGQGAGINEFALITLEYQHEEKSKNVSSDEIEKFINTSINWVRKHNV
jgi:hypothetical protein